MALGLGSLPSDKVLDDGVEEAPRASARSVLKAVAREKTRTTMNRLTGQMARARRVRRNSLMVWPTREKVMWSMRAASGALDELAGALGLVAVLPAPRPAVEPAAALGLDPAFADAGEGHDAGRDGAREDAPDTLRRRPLRSSMRWICALPTNGCLRRISSTFHRYIVQRLTPITFKAACPAQPAARSSSYRRIADRARGPRPAGRRRRP